VGALIPIHRHGIAFDNGALNRVVRIGEDDEEMQRLDLFLLAPKPQDRASVGSYTTTDGMRTSFGKTSSLLDVGETDETTIKMGMRIPVTVGEYCTG
jgi:hypothetical protein